MIAHLYSKYRRAARADAHRLARPVISIGNISMGGRGKTPLAAHVAQLLIAAGERPSILSRGYGREITADGVTVVSDGHAIVSDVAHSGDEPLMLARAVPGAAVLVCEQRALAGTLAERALGCTVHVLDDGFQHHRLHRDIDIVIVSEADLAGRPLPFGKLREPVDVLADADALITEIGTGSNFLENYSRSHFSLTRHLSTRAPGHPGTRVFAVAGIANPDRFFDALKGAGYDVAGTLGFSDHHRFSKADVQRISAAAASAGAAAIVTTAKDKVRLEDVFGWPMPLVEIPLVVSVEPAAEFHAWLFRRLAEARA